MIEDKHIRQMTETAMGTAELVADATELSMKLDKKLSKITLEGTETAAAIELVAEALGNNLEALAAINLIAGVVLEASNAGKLAYEALKASTAACNATRVLVTDITATTEAYMDLNEE